MSLFLAYSYCDIRYPCFVFELMWINFSSSFYVFEGKWTFLWKNIHTCQLWFSKVWIYLYLIYFWSLKHSNVFRFYYLSLVIIFQSGLFIFSYIFEQRVHAANFTFLVEIIIEKCFFFYRSLLLTPLYFAVV